MKRKAPKLFQGISGAKSRFRKATGLVHFQLTPPKPRHKPKRTLSSFFKFLKK